MPTFNPIFFSKKIHIKKLQIKSIYINSNQSWFYNQRLKKKFKVEKFGRKCQHSPNFFFQKIRNKKYGIIFLKKFQPIMVLQSMPQKNILK